MIELPKLKRFLLTLLGVALCTGFGSWLLYMDNKAERVTIENPAQESVASAVELQEESINQEGKIDVNTADENMLMLLPGVGPELAQRIIAFRTETPFKTVRDLKKVSGIGDKKFAELEPHVCVKPIN